jgi:hypothetical protein
MSWQLPGGLSTALPEKRSCIVSATTQLSGFARH